MADGFESRADLHATKIHNVQQALPASLKPVRPASEPRGSRQQGHDPWKQQHLRIRAPCIKPAGRLVVPWPWPPGRTGGLSGFPRRQHGRSQKRTLPGF